MFINNLVASSLWHRLSVLEPPEGVLGKIQVKMIHFFWDWLHWLPQNVLYLPKEEGGQGVADLISRKVAFRLQFVKKFLYNPNISWFVPACCLLSTVGGWGFRRNIFWTDCKSFHLKSISSFYESVRRAWCVVQVKTSMSCKSLYWFLEEPLINGARLEFCGHTTLWLMQTLTNPKLLKWRT